MPGTPIKLLWSREEDMVQGRYHPIMHAKLTGGLDANNNLTGLHIRLSGQSILAAVRPQSSSSRRGATRSPSRAWRTAASTRSATTSRTC